jgi:hypothetical protein
MITMAEFEWSKEALENSISSRCWNYTPYEEGWDTCPDLRKDSELKQIVAMEQELGDIPEWARRLVEKDINYVGPCGHYKFPKPQLEIISAIGSQTPPVLVHTCYTVDRERKRQMMDYCLCLDAWLAGARAEPTAQELMALGCRKIDWMSVCEDMWNIIGEHSEAKDLLVERMLHLLRHSIKWCIWDDDMATKFGRDQYLGDYSAGTWRYGNPHIRIAGFQENASPRLKRIEARLAEINNHVRLDLREWWLCAPKSFRFLERNLWVIGMGRLPADEEEIPGFLQCEDTYPNQDAAADWYTSFRKALNGWWRGQPETGDMADDLNRRLGESTPVKHWLVRLFLRKLRRLEENGEQFTNLVMPGHSHRRGTRPIV